MVAPVIVVMVSWVLESNVIVFWNSEESLEDLAEITEEEVSVDLVNDLNRELLKHLTLSLVINGLVLVVDPLVVEMALDLFFQGNLKWYILIESSDETKETSKLISFVKV